MYAVVIRLPFEMVPVVVTLVYVQLSISHFILTTADGDILFCLIPLSDAFDSQFGAVILRLKEGLDVSHIQGQGMKHMNKHPKHDSRKGFSNEFETNVFSIFTCNIL